MGNSQAPGLIIHDLNNEEWEAVRADYDGWDVVCDNGKIRPCIGCFSCWHKDPGRCVIRDGYDDMGARIRRASEVVVISRYTYGGFSGFVKNVFDRCLGYVLPQFEVIEGETHHKKRYDEDKPFTFIFRGTYLSDREKQSARCYVEAVCANIRGHVKDVIFRDEQAVPEQPAGEAMNASVTKGAPDKVVLLNGSMRAENGNSARLARRLKDHLQAEAEIIDLKGFLNDLPGLVETLEDADAVVLCVPLYVDGLPSQVIRFMETFEEKYRGEPKKIYVLANMGLYESRQLVNLFEAARQWCVRTGAAFGGGLGVSAGELLGTLIEITPFGKGPAKKAAAGIVRMAQAVDGGRRMKIALAEPVRFPRWLYIRIANAGWRGMAKKNGIRPKDLYRRIDPGF